MSGAAEESSERVHRLEIPGWARVSRRQPSPPRRDRAAAGRRFSEAENQRGNQPAISKQQKTRGGKVKTPGMERAIGENVTTVQRATHHEPIRSLHVATDSAPVLTTEVWSQHNPTERFGYEYASASVSHDEGSLRRSRGSPYIGRNAGGTSNQQTRSYECLVPGLNTSWQENEGELPCYINQKANRFRYGALRRDDCETTVSAPDVNIAMSSGRYEQWDAIGVTGGGAPYGTRPPVVVHKPAFGGSRDGRHNDLWKNAFPGVATKLIASAPDVSLKEPGRRPAWNTLRALATIGSAPEKTASSPDVHRPAPVANGWNAPSPRGYPPRMLGSAPDLNLAMVHSAGKKLNEFVTGPNQNARYQDPGMLVSRGQERNLQLMHREQIPLEVLQQKCGNSAPDVRMPTGSPWADRSNKYDSHPSLCTHDDRTLYKTPECSACCRRHTPVGEFRRHVADHHTVHHHHVRPRPQQVDEVGRCHCDNGSWPSVATSRHYCRHNNGVTTDFGSHGHHSTTHYSHVTTVHCGVPSRMDDNCCYHSTCMPHEHNPPHSHYQHQHVHCHHEHKVKCIPNYHSCIDDGHKHGCQNFHMHFSYDGCNVAEVPESHCFCYEQGPRHCQQPCCTPPSFQEVSPADFRRSRHDGRNRYFWRDGGFSSNVPQPEISDGSGLLAVPAAPFDGADSCDAAVSPVPHVSEWGKCAVRDSATRPPGALTSAFAGAAAPPGGRAEKLVATPPGSTRASRGRRSGAGTTVQAAEGAAHPATVPAMLAGWSALAPGEASDEGCCSLSPRVATPGAADAEEPPPAPSPAASSAPGGGWPWPSGDPRLEAQPPAVAGSVPERATRCLSCADSALGLDDEASAVDLSAPVETATPPPAALQHLPDQTAPRCHQQTTLCDLDYDQKGVRQQWTEELEAATSPPPDDGRYDSGLGPEDVPPSGLYRHQCMPSWSPAVDRFKKPTVTRLDSGFGIEDNRDHDVGKVTKDIELMRLRELEGVSDGSLWTKDCFGGDKSSKLSGDSLNERKGQDQHVRASSLGHITGDERQQWYSLSRVNEQSEPRISDSTRRPSEVILDGNEIFGTVGLRGNGVDRGKNLEVCSKWCETGKVTSESTEDLCAEIRRNHAAEWEEACDESGDVPSDRDWPELRKASSVTSEDERVCSWPGRQEEMVPAAPWSAEDGRECSWQGRQEEIVSATSWNEFCPDAGPKRWTSWNAGEMFGDRDGEEPERQPPEMGTLGGLYLLGRSGIKFDPERDTVLHHGDHEDLTGESEDCVVELRRQSTQSFEDGEEGPPGQARYWRTPSVVVSDYSDDVPYCGPPGAGGCDAGADDGDQLSECGSSCSGLETDVDSSGLLTPERKASDCSTCSTLSGDDDASVEALLQPVRTRPKAVCQRRTKA